MRFDNVSILSVAHVDGPHRVTSAEIEDRLAAVMKRYWGRSDLLRGLSGIEARRFFDPGTQPSMVATQAAEIALERAARERNGFDRQAVGVLINTSVCRDFIEPSVASLVHSNLGLGPGCMSFDLGNACLAFMNAMAVAGNMIERGQVDYALVVDGECARYVVEATLDRLAEVQDEQTLREQFATLTLGSGAAAMVLGRAEGSDGHRFRGQVNVAATQHNHLCRGQVDHMRTDTQGLLVAGIELAAQALEKAGEELGWKKEELQQYVLHQVSRVHTERLAERLDLDLDKVYAVYPEHGNVGPAAIPIVLSKSVEEGRIQPGDRVAMMGIGSGLNCTMAEVVW